jgi:SecD/SecF fusion protein
MDKNLFWKTLLIVVLALWTAWGLFPPQDKLKQGLDLKGGTSLIYEIDTTGLEAAEQKDLAQNMIPILLKRINQTLSNIVMRPQGNTRIEIQLPLASDSTRQKRQAYDEALESLEAENINLLKIRQTLNLDPDARSAAFDQFAHGNEQRRRILDKLAEVYDLRKQKQAQRDMLAGEMESVREEFDTVGLDFELLVGRIPNWVKQPSDQRTAAIETYVKNTLNADGAAEALTDEQTKAVSLINQYIELYSKRAPILDELVQPDGLNDQWRAAVSDLQQLNLNIELVREVLEMPAESATRAARLEEFRTAYPDRVEQLDAVAAAYTEYSKVGGQLDDPEDLKRMLKGSGVLEFRILATPQDVDAGDLAGYREGILSKGPKGASDSRYTWCQVEDPETWPMGLGVTASFGEKLYVLCSNQTNQTLLQGGDKKWKLKKAYPTNDQQGRRAIGFTFDDVAAAKFFRITSDNLEKPLGILLDDQVLSAPSINSAIMSSGIITGGSTGFTQTEVSDMVNKLNAGSFPARLSEVPISEKSISATLGADNLKKGVTAGLIGLAAVAVFMLVYYMLSGAIADLALMLNILFVLGIMALLNATFTLPGIAGLILTIGMSVDANVLIYERIREEQNRGSSLKAAIANGYQRAFRTIFDANLTTFGVAAILYMAASEEIKGFAIVLMLGILSSMFTALFVTRVVYDWLTSTRLISNRLAMLGMMQNVKVNWMGLRPVFLTISSVLLIGGLAVFFVRGNNPANSKYDIEFIGGTSVEIELKPGTNYDRAMVENRINEYLKTPAKVYEIGETGQQSEGSRRFEISTTETNTTTATVTLAEGQTATAESLAAKIEETADELARPLSKLKVTPAGDRVFDVSTSRVNATLVEEVLTQAMGDTATVTKIDVQETVSDAVRTAFKDLLVVRENLGLEFTGETKIEIGSEDATMLPDYLGGIELRFTLDTPTTPADLEARIANMRYKPDMQDLTWYSYKLLKWDLTEPQPDEPLTEFVYVSTHPDAGYRELDETEWARFVENEKQTVAGAAGLESTLSRVTQIDPSVGSESKQRAIVAIILSLLAIVGYIWVRFGTARYGVAAIAALVHDVIITLGIVTACTWIAGKPLGNALLIGDFKINLEMVAAFLTIIGYSLNDTIVVFDRIRENRGKLSILTPDMISASINQTLSRTLLTSFTTFLVVLVMYIWGGEGLRGFTFAMLIGIIVGTYSSIAIASPLLLLWAPKEAK